MKITKTKKEDLQKEIDELKALKNEKIQLDKLTKERNDLKAELGIFNKIRKLSKRFR